MSMFPPENPDYFPGDELDGFGPGEEPMILLDAADIRDDLGGIADGYQVNVDEGTVLMASRDVVPGTEQPLLVGEVVDIVGEDNNPFNVTVERDAGNLSGTLHGACVVNEYGDLAQKYYVGDQEITAAEYRQALADHDGEEYWDFEFPTDSGDPDTYQSIEERWPEDGVDDLTLPGLQLAMEYGDGPYVAIRDWVYSQDAQDVIDMAVDVTGDDTIDTVAEANLALQVHASEMLNEDGIPVTYEDGTEAMTYTLEGYQNADGDEISGREFPIFRDNGDGALELRTPLFWDFGRLFTTS